MLTIQGKLLVRNPREHYRKASKEAWLKCSLGKFRVKSFYLENIEIGEHEGFFTVIKIEPRCQSHQGKFLLELEAVVDKMAFIAQAANSPFVHNTAIKQVQQLSLIAEEEAANAEEDKLSMPSSINTQHRFIQEENPLDEEDEEEEMDEDAQLFGALYPLGEEVELDVSQDRSILRQQVERLKQLSYQFNSQAQKWILPYADAASY